MKVDLNKNMIGIDGVEIQNSNIGIMVANLLANANLGDTQKTISWAMDLHKGKVLYFDERDYNLFMNFIVNNSNIADLLEYRVLECLNQR